MCVSTTMEGKIRFSCRNLRGNDVREPSREYGGSLRVDSENVRVYRRAAVEPGPVVSLIGWTKAPLPAESHTANRTHFFPVVSNGIWK